MSTRKDETERAINLLKFYKSKLSKTEDKSLRKAMDKLVESLETPLFTALLDIQEFYEVSLSTAIDGTQEKPYEVIEEIHEEPPQEIPVKLKKEKSKKSRRRKSEEDVEPEEVEIPQRTSKESSEDKHKPRPESAKQTKQDSRDSKPNYKHEEYEEHEENIDDDQNPWLYFEIDLVKGKKGYGFAVAGGYNKPHYEGDNGIFVTKIITEGAAEVDGRLKIDDVIVSVNEVNLEYVTHETAVDTLKNAGQNMTLVIRRLKDDFIENEHAINENLQEHPADGAYYSPEHEEYEEEPVENPNFQQFEIKLTKRATGGLGISIQGGYDPSNQEEDSYISISKLTPNGVADIDGRLQVGDLILQVDDQSLNGVTHEEAVNLLKNTGKQVGLYIGRFVEMEPEPEPEPEPIVEKGDKKKKKKHRRDRE